VTDFTDPANVKEIAFFDRGPMSAERLYTGGYWSAYWYNGLVYGSEIGRGLDIFQLTPSEFLTANELEAAALVQQDSFNPQWQTRIVWPAHPSVARAYLDQLARGSSVPAAQLTRFRTAIDAAVGMPAGAGKRRALERIAAEIAPLAQRASGADKARLSGLNEVLGRIATAPR